VIARGLEIVFVDKSMFIVEGDYCSMTIGLAEGDRYSGSTYLRAQPAAVSSPGSMQVH
jgi:hypothetical protein